MSNPQIENGYTRIANELFEAIIKHPFSRREYAVLMCIIRCTYGFNKKEDAISGWQISEMTGIDRSHISKTINELSKNNIILKSDHGRISHGQNVPFLSINKHYKTWITVAELATPTVAETATVAKTAPLPNQPHTVAELATPTVAELAEQPLLKQPTHKDIPKDNTKDIPKDSMQQPTATAINDEKNTPLQLACKATWKAYSDSFENRYQIKPNRNAKNSSQIKQFVQNVGFDESPQVAIFYLTHNSSFYVNNMHTVGVMLKDCEKLRNEWASGNVIQIQQYKSSGQQRIENTNKAVAEFLGESDKSNIIEGEYQHA
jgi:phage replication O-like protein O